MAGFDGEKYNLARYESHVLQNAAPSIGELPTPAQLRPSALRDSEKRRVTPLVRYGLPILAFMVPMFLLALTNAFAADRSISEKENRTLAAMPSLSAQNIFSGKFSAEFQTYFADQFAGRDFWLNANTAITSVYTGTGGEEIIALDKKADFGGQALHPQKTPSKPTIDSSAAIAAASSAASSVTLPEEEDISEEKNYIIVDKKNYRAMELYTNVASKNEAYAAAVSRLQTKVPTAQVYCLMAPTSLEFYSSESYHTGSKSQKKAIDGLYAALTNGVKGVDAYTPISQHLNEYLYFRTDHHWTARGAYYAYTALAKAAGLTPVPLGEPSGQLDGFVGTLYRYTQNGLLKDHPDSVEYFEPSIAATVQVFEDASLQNGHTIPLITKSIENESDKYMTFIEGDHPMTRIDSGVGNGRSILVIKESYGNAIIPYLVNHYARIYVLDPRQLQTDIQTFVKANNISEVLCINYMFAPLNATYINAFEAAIGE